MKGYQKLWRDLRWAPTDEDNVRLLCYGSSKRVDRDAWVHWLHDWTWKNCPAAWHGRFRGYCHDSTIMLKAVVLEDLWIWHSYFRVPSSHSDLNVLKRSLYTRLVAGQAPPCNYVVNGHHYNLADGIYPQGITLVRIIQSDKDNTISHIAICQISHEKGCWESFWWVAGLLCYCLWPCWVLRPKDNVEDHDNMINTDEVNQETLTTITMGY